MYTLAPWPGFETLRDAVSLATDGEQELPEICQSVGSFVKTAPDLADKKAITAPFKRSVCVFWKSNKHTWSELFKMQVHNISQEPNLDSRNAQIGCKDYIQTAKQLNANISCNHESHFLDDFYQQETITHRVEATA